jgi:type IX secretion system PorP/SprF family membrane protein
MLKYYFFLFFLIKTSISLAQDERYSMYFNSPMMANPALLGTKSQATLSYHSRNEHINIPSEINYRIPNLSLVVPFVKNKYDEKGDANGENNRFGGVGIAFNNQSERGGAKKIIGASIGLAYNFSLIKEKQLFFSVGASASRYQRSTKTISNISNRTNYNTFSTGIWVYQEDNKHQNEQKMFLGASIYNLTLKDTTLFDTPNDTQGFRYHLVAGVRVYRGKKYSITPNMRVIQENNDQNFNLGSFFRYHFSDNAGSLFQYGFLGAGVWYSTQRTIITSIEFNTPTITTGFSYDWKISDKSLYNASEWTISIKKRIGKKKVERKIINDEEPEVIE